MAIKFTDVDRVARETRCTAGLLEAEPHGGVMVDARTGCPVSPEKIEAVQVFGTYNALQVFDDAIRAAYGTHFQWKRDNCGAYLRLDASRVDFQ